MSNRRTLTEALKSAPQINPEIAARFVKGEPTDDSPTQTIAAAKSATAISTQAVPARAEPGQAAGVNARVPLTTRVRPDLAAALKRASLERQLAGTQPNTVQDILEEALEPWLRSQGYLPERPV